MSDLEFAQLAALCRACARLYARNLLAAGDGNVSVRLPDGRIAMTPSGLSKAELRPGQLTFLRPEGRILSGTPSSERRMHLAIYRSCPQARAVVHAHPPTAVAWSLARPDLRELPADVLPELILAAGTIPIVPYARPGTEEMVTALQPYLPAHRLMVLSRHGGLAWGEDLEEAVGGLERLEHVAQILKGAADLGGFSPLPAQELEALREIRRGLGPRLR
jgi:L-fuculose-phosphate aldolase